MLLNTSHKYSDIPIHPLGPTLLLWFRSHTPWWSRAIDQGCWRRKNLDVQHQQYLLTSSQCSTCQTPSNLSGFCETSTMIGASLSLPLSVHPPHVHIYNLNAYLSLAQFVCEVSMILRAENCHSASSRHLHNKWRDIRHHWDRQGLPGNMSPQLQYKLPSYHYLISMYQLLEYFRI